MAQQIVEKRGIEKHNLARTGRMALYGGGTCTPQTNKARHTLTMHSNIRPSSNNMVFLPPTPHRPLQQPVLKRHNPDPRRP
jgi:hypothetical protein